MALISLATTGCIFKKKAPPVAVVSKPPLRPFSLPKKPDPPVVAEPQIQVAADAELPELTLPVDSPKVVPPPPKPRRRPSQSASQNPVLSQEEAPPLPQLGAVLSPQERDRLSEEYSVRKKRAEAVLSRSSARSLSGQQLETLQRVRSFLRQAEDQRAQDLATAVQLVRRADLLAADLVGSLH